MISYADPSVAITSMSLFVKRFHNKSLGNTIDLSEIQQKKYMISNKNAKRKTILLKKQDAYVKKAIL